MLTAVSSVFAACDDCSQRKNAATKKRRPMTLSDHDTTLHPFQLVAKRGFDIVVSAAGLIVLSPLFLLISVAIKLGSRGPIFSAKYEYCYNDKRIRTIKFRTIGSLFFTTRIGHFLISEWDRATSHVDKCSAWRNVDCRTTLSYHSSVNPGF